MKIVRFIADGLLRYGLLENQTVYGSGEDPFLLPAGKAPVPDGSKYDLSQVRLLVPCEPTKIIGLGLNYAPHVGELKYVKSEIPESPIIFLKPLTSLTGPEEYIIKPGPDSIVGYEGEVGVVIGKEGKDIPESDAMEYVFGYTCVNDVTNRAAQRKDGQWTRAKGYDTFCPVGPCIQTEGDPEKIKIETYLNGELRQSSDTGSLVFGIRHLISFISEVMTLYPGDVIATGTPAGVGEMFAGDVIEIKVENVGTLRNFVKDK